MLALAAFVAAGIGRSLALDVGSLQAMHWYPTGGVVPLYATCDTLGPGGVPPIPGNSATVPPPATLNSAWVPHSFLALDWDTFLIAGLRSGGPVSDGRLWGDVMITGDGGGTWHCLSRNDSVVARPGSIAFVVQRSVLIAGSNTSRAQEALCIAGGRSLTTSPDEDPSPLYSAPSSEVHCAAIPRPRALAPHNASLLSASMRLPPLEWRRAPNLPSAAMGMVHTAVPISDPLNNGTAPYVHTSSASESDFGSEPVVDDDNSAAESLHLLVGGTREDGSNDVWLAAFPELPPGGVGAGAPADAALVTPSAWGRVGVLRARGFASDSLRPVSLMRSALQYVPLDRTLLVTGGAIAINWRRRLGGARRRHPAAAGRIRRRAAAVEVAPPLRASGDTLRAADRRAEGVQPGVKHHSLSTDGIDGKIDDLGGGGVNTTGDEGSGVNSATEVAEEWSARRGEGMDLQTGGQLSDSYLMDTLALSLPPLDELLAAGAAARAGLPVPNATTFISKRHPLQMPAPRSVTPGVATSIGSSRLPVWPHIVLGDVEAGAAVDLGACGGRATLGRDTPPEACTTVIAHIGEHSYRSTTGSTAAGPSQLLRMGSHVEYKAGRREPVERSNAAGSLLGVHMVHPYRMRSPGGSGAVAVRYPHVLVGQWHTGQLYRGTMASCVWDPECPDGMVPSPCTGPGTASCMPKRPGTIPVPPDEGSGDGSIGNGDGGEDGGSNADGSAQTSRQCLPVSDLRWVQYLGGAVIAGVAASVIAAGVHLFSSSSPPASVGSDDKQQPGAGAGKRVSVLAAASAVLTHFGAIASVGSGLLLGATAPGMTNRGASALLRGIVSIVFLAPLCLTGLLLATSALLPAAKLRSTLLAAVRAQGAWGMVLLLASPWRPSQLLALLQDAGGGSTAAGMSSRAERVAARNPGAGGPRFRGALLSCVQCLQSIVTDLPLLAMGAALLLTLCNGTPGTIASRWPWPLALVLAMATLRACEALARASLACRACRKRARPATGNHHSKSLRDGVVVGASPGGGAGSAGSAATGDSVLGGPAPGQLGHAGDDMERGLQRQQRNPLAAAAGAAGLRAASQSNHNQQHNSTHYHQQQLYEARPVAAVPPASHNVASSSSASGKPAPSAAAGYNRESFTRLPIRTGSEPGHGAASNATSGRSDVAHPTNFTGGVPQSSSASNSGSYLTSTVNTTGSLPPAALPMILNGASDAVAPTTPMAAATPQALVSVADLALRAATPEGRRLADYGLFLRSHASLLPQALRAVQCTPLPPPWVRLLRALDSAMTSSGGRFEAVAAAGNEELRRMQLLQSDVGLPAPAAAAAPSVGASLSTAGSTSGSGANALRVARRGRLVLPTGDDTSSSGGSSVCTEGSVGRGRTRSRNGAESHSEDDGDDDANDESDEIGTGSVAARREPAWLGAGGSGRSSPTRAHPRRRNDSAESELEASSGEPDQ